jgi:alginate O-acetyltransferase complex protein AlgI
VLWKGMVGVYGATLPQAVFYRLGPIAGWLTALGVQPAWTSGSMLLEATSRIGVSLVIALALPNTLEILAAYEPALGVRQAKVPSRLVRSLVWAPTRTWAIGLACVTLAGILSLGELSEFLYWQF